MPSSSAHAGAGISPEESGLLHGIISALVDPILVLDPEGLCLWVSRGAAEALGRPADSLRGRSWQEAVADAFTRRVLQDSWDRLLESGLPIREEVAHPGPSGLRHFELLLTPVKRKDGGLEAVVLVTRDNTHRRAVEETLRQTEEQLRHAQKLDSLGQLAGGIAHDFNNLLTVVNGYSDLLLQTLPLDPLPGQTEADSARALVEEIRKAGQKASMLTQQLLAFGRKQSSLPKALDLNQVVRDMEKMLRRALAHPIEMAVHLHAGLPMVVSDPGQVGQVLMNLVLNARDALPKGGRIAITTLEVRLTGEEDDLLLSPQAGSYSALRVEDDGVGIGPEIRSRLFEPFFSTKEKGKGTGLGLSTVYGIVKQSGGGIALRSQPRKGAAFTIYLPQAESTAEEPGAAAQAETRPGALPATILVVEDEEPVRRLVAGILASEGYRVIEASSGAAAMQAFALAGQGVDLVLSDILMPGMSGRELVQALQSMRPSLKVIFMSGYIDDEAFVEGLGSGSAPFLAKPFSPGDLIAKVRGVLEPDLAKSPNVTP